jgi:hypothetical protein
MHRVGIVTASIRIPREPTEEPGVETLRGLGGSGGLEGFGISFKPRSKGVQQRFSRMVSRRDARRTVELQFITVSETGASELLPLRPETIRVFLVIREPRVTWKPEPPVSKTSTLPAPWLAVRRFGAYQSPLRS